MLKEILRKGIFNSNKITRNKGSHEKESIVTSYRRWHLSLTLKVGMFIRLMVRGGHFKTENQT